MPARTRPSDRFAHADGSTNRRATASSSPMRAARTCSCTSAPLTRAPQRGRSQGQGGLGSGRGCCARRGAAPGRAWCETGRANRGAWCEARQANPAEGGAGDAPPGVLNETTPSLIIFKLAAVLREWLRLPPGTPHNEQRPEELLLGSVPRLLCTIRHCSEIVARATVSASPPGRASELANVG